MQFTSNVSGKDTCYGIFVILAQTVHLKQECSDIFDSGIHQVGVKNSGQLIVMTIP